MKKPLLIITALICTLIAGCKIDESGIPHAQSSTLLIGQWFIKNSTSTDPSTGITDFENYYTAADFYKFNTDNTFQYSGSSTPPQAPYTFTSRYSYAQSSSGQTLTLTDPSFPDNPVVYTINKLTSDSLIMTTTGLISISITSTSPGSSTATTTTVPITYKLAHK